MFNILTQIDEHILRTTRFGIDAESATSGAKMLDSALMPNRAKFKRKYLIRHLPSFLQNNKIGLQILNVHLNFVHIMIMQHFLIHNDSCQDIYRMLMTFCCTLFESKTKKGESPLIPQKSQRFR